MKAEATSRIGIIGFGRAGYVHLQASELVPGSRVTAVADPAATARERAEKLGLRAYASPGEMIENEDLQGVCVCSPPGSHAEVTIGALKRGMHVLCEKPLALNVWDALRMQQAATNHDRALLLATKFRYAPGLRAAREVLESGRIGDPLAFDISFCSMVDMSGRWNSNPVLAGGGVIMDNGVHAIDIAAFLFGAVTQVQATAWRPQQKLQVEDSATICMRTAGDVVGRADVSWSVETGRDSYVTVYGSDGALEVGWVTCRLRMAGEAWRDLGGGYDKVDCHRRMHADFANVLRTDGRDSHAWLYNSASLQTVSAIEAAYRSLSSGQWEWVGVDISRLGESEKRAEIGV